MMDRIDVGWDQIVDAATRSGWTTYVGTADADGRPHVAVVAPGFTDGAVWFATRRSSKKFRNLAENTAVAFHWPVGNAEAPGELAAWGTATVHDSDEDRHRLWDAGILPYDLSAFFGSADNADFAFIEVRIGRARIQTQHDAQVWTAGSAASP